MLYFWMRRLLAFYDHGKDKAKIRYDHSAFQEPASIGTGGLRRKRSESVKQYARIVWASLISSLEVARYDCLPHRFSPTFQPLFSVENWKKKEFSTRVWTCVIFENFFAFSYSCFMFHDCPLAGNKRRLFEIFSVI